MKMGRPLTKNSITGEAIRRALASGPKTATAVAKILGRRPVQVQNRFVALIDGRPPWLFREKVDGVWHYRLDPPNATPFTFCG